MPARLSPPCCTSTSPESAICELVSLEAGPMYSEYPVRLIRTPDEVETLNESLARPTGPMLFAVTLNLNKSTSEPEPVTWSVVILPSATVGMLLYELNELKAVL